MLIIFACFCTDIQLNVKGLRNLEAGFKDYIAEETLDGENKYQAEGHGLQDAKKGIIFEHFPPVLHLQLKRFEYDMMRDVNVKVSWLKKKSAPGTQAKRQLLQLVILTAIGSAFIHR